MVFRLSSRNLACLLPGLAKRDVDNPKNANVDREGNLGQAIRPVAGARNGTARFNKDGDTD